MSQLEDRLFNEIEKIRIIDPHTHIDPLSPSSKSLSDLLGYHYYTELAHSSGLPKAQIEGSTGLEQAERIVGQLADCSNTVQYSWLVEIAQEMFGHGDDQVTVENLPTLYANAEKVLADPNWTDKLFERSGLEAVFLTNDFDDPLEGFDTSRYVPCLRTDDLVFKLALKSVQERVEKATGLAWSKIGDVLDRLFSHFVEKGARACAISLPPDFEPVRPGGRELAEAIERIGSGKASTDDEKALSMGVFYGLADRCEEHGLPFDLMIGVRREVYQHGVYQGRDLFDQRTSLYPYRRLFNEKSKVVFPISVLTHSQNQELASFSWIFPNVVTSGHWWYSNIPVYIEADTRARLEAVPSNKQIGYYSDAYKLEFVPPKFRMYRRCLARVLARDFVEARRWPEERAIELARTVLRTNVEKIFRV